MTKIQKYNIHDVSIWCAFVIFVKFATVIIPISLACLLESHPLAKFCHICHICSRWGTNSHSLGQTNMVGNKFAQFYWESIMARQFTQHQPDWESLGIINEFIQRSYILKTMKELKRQLKLTRTNVPLPTLWDLSHSMLKRGLQNVIKNDGGHAGYWNYVKWWK